MTAPPKKGTTGEPSELLAKADIDAILESRHWDPFAVLGVHLVSGGAAGDTYVARCFLPGATEVTAQTLAGKDIGALKQLHPAGIFAGEVALKKLQPIRYRARNEGGEWEVHDPYSFGPVLGPMDDYYIGEGSHLRLFDKLGAHAIEFDGVSGTHFAVWAPNARRVSVVGPFNDWDGRRHPMRVRLTTGVWEVFIPNVGPGTIYKYEIVGADGAPLPARTTGEIVARGGNIMRGYWRDPEQTAKVLRADGLHTGDLGWLDEDGFLYIVGRESEMIKAGAHRISPREIEDVIEAIDGVRECAVVGVPDEQLGQAILAVVAPRDGHEIERQRRLRSLRGGQEHDQAPVHGGPRVPHVWRLPDRVPVEEEVQGGRVGKLVGEDPAGRGRHRGDRRHRRRIPPLTAYGSFTPALISRPVISRVRVSAETLCRYSFTLSTARNRIFPIAAMLTALASGFWSFVSFRFLLGLGEAGNWPGATKAVSEWFPRRETGWAVALFDSGSSIGGMIAPVLVFGLVFIVSVIGSFMSFPEFLTMTNGGPGGATTPIMMRIYNVSFKSYKLGYGAALSFVLMLALLLLTIVQLRLSRDRTAG